MVVEPFLTGRGMRINVRPFCMNVARLPGLRHLPACDCAAGAVWIMMGTARRDCHTLHGRI